MRSPGAAAVTADWIDAYPGLVQFCPGGMYRPPFGSSSLTQCVAARADVPVTRSKTRVSMSALATPTLDGDTSCMMLLAFCRKDGHCDDVLAQIQVAILGEGIIGRPP